jgi:hypothetical protein
MATLEDSLIKEVLLESGVVLKLVDIADRKVWSDGSGKGFYRLDPIKKMAVALERKKVIHPDSAV